MDQGGKMILSFRFSSDIKLMNLLFDSMEGFCKALELDLNSCWKEFLALREVVTNAVLHGNKQDPAKKVEIVIERKPDRLVFVVKDEGKGFDFEAEGKEPETEEEILAVSGRGLFLAKRIMDKVSYRYEEGSIIEMEKEL